MKRQNSIARRGLRALFALAVALTSLLPLTASAARPIDRPKLPPTGEQRNFDLRIGPTSLGRTFTVRTADASFVKLHIDHFSLPDGVTLEVSNPAGTEVYRYSNKHRDGYTVNRSIGHNGRTSFSAMSIQGPVALVRLVGTPRGAWRTTDGVRISRYFQGYSERKLREISPVVRKIIGADDQNPVACFAASDPVAVERTRPIAILMPVGCTAWRVGPGNHMITNNHCIASAAEAAESELWFDFQASTCSGAARTPVKVPADQMLTTSSALDYTLFTVKNFSTISNFGYLGLETRAPISNEEIFIAGHPNFRAKELTVLSDQDGGGRCRVNFVNNGADEINYYCDTEPGNSGSPVIARSSNKVVALHHAGGDTYNYGVKMSYIWPQVSAYFGGVVPDGDNGGSSSTYSVSGTVTTSSGAGISGVSVSNGSTSVTTSASGAYTFTGLGNRSYTLTPSLSGYTFSPVNRTVTVNGANVTGQNFTGTAPSTSCGGRVLCSGTAVALPTVTTAKVFSSAYTLVVPAGKTSVTFTLSGGTSTSDADMYVNLGSALTTPVSAAVNTATRCVPWKGGSAETCTFTPPAAGGTYYVTVYAYTAYSGVSLKGTISP